MSLLPRVPSPFLLGQGFPSSGAVLGVGRELRTTASIRKGKGVDKYRSPPPSGNERETKNLGKARQRNASLAHQSIRTGSDMSPEWTLPWEGGLGSPTWRIWLQSAPLWVEGGGEGLFRGRKLGAEGAEGQGLPRGA